MTKLFSVPFPAGRPRLSPTEEESIIQQAAKPSAQGPLRDSSTVLVVIGYQDAHGDTDESKRTAFRRAQLIIDLLHDKCRFTGSCQATTMAVKELPGKDRANKEATVEVWMVNP